MGKSIVGIDPGNSGALVLLLKGQFRFWEMPVIEIGKQVDMDYRELWSILNGVEGRGRDRLDTHVYLERAVPFAMGTKSAFNYGRGFAAIEIALQDLDLPFTLVEPGKWTKVMHAGIKGDLKPKAKSLIAAKRLFPKFFPKIPVGPRSKAPHNGVIDALLIAGYGQRQNGEVVTQSNDEDFY